MVRVTAPAPRGAWRALVAGDPQALPEHAPEWVDAICASGPWQDASRLYELDDGRRFLLPLVSRRGAAGLGGWLSSYPPAWGMGGLVGAGQDARAVAEVVEDLRSVRALRVWVRPDPLAGGWQVLQGDPRTAAMPRHAHVLDLSGGEGAVLAGLRASTRRNVRRAQRAGVRVEVDRGGRLVPVHWDLYMRSVERWAVRQHEPLALARWRAERRDPVEKLLAMSRHLGDRCAVVVAYVGARPAASAIVLLGQTSHYTRGAMDVELASPVRASHLVQWEAIRLAIASGCRVHHMGESGSSASLAQFKEGFGARRVSYTEYHLERLPWTRVDTAVRRSAKLVLRFRDA